MVTALALASCTPPGQGGDSPSIAASTASTVPATTSTTAFSSGDLADPDIRQVVVGGQPLSVAWADTPEERSRGLMDVSDLGDLDGMVFDLGEERSVSFTMRDTVTSLDIYFFAEDGQGVGMLEMEPCQEEPCPSYSIDEPIRYALEVPAGSHRFDPVPDLQVP